jgi:hemerythrin-like metal-binding protein
MFFKWDVALELGIPSIDRQHKTLVDMVNHFYDTLNSGDYDQKIGELLEGLANYTAKHFAHEEKYMKMYDPKLYESHKKIHDAFVAQVTELITKHKAGQNVLSIKVTKMVKEWIVNHIKGDDKDYVELFKKHNVQ